MILNKRVSTTIRALRLSNISHRYAQQQKKIHLLNLSEECSALLHKADHIVEIRVLEGLDHHIADDRLA